MDNQFIYFEERVSINGRFWLIVNFENTLGPQKQLCTYIATFIHFAFSQK